MEPIKKLLAAITHGNSFSVSLKKGLLQAPSFSVQILVCSLRFPIAATPGKALIKLGVLLEKCKKINMFTVIKSVNSIQA
jgi:hypothetical protein